MGQISLDEAHAIMKRVDKRGQLIPFSGAAVTLDMERNTGGEHFVFDAAVLTSPGGNRKQYHDRNDTRRIKLIPSGEIRAFNPLLLFRINGKEVYI